MNPALDDFARRIDAQLASAGHEPTWEPAVAQDQMAHFAERRQQFDQVAARLMSDMIRPRMETLASRFPQARLTQLGPHGRCACWFGYTERFPASVKVELSVEHDRGFQHAVLHSELYIIPAFVKYDAHDKLSLRIDDVDEAAVAAWVEERLLAAVETYLQLDRGAADVADEPVTDPVCGMRIKRSEAVAQMDHRGHPYFFCADSCRRQFAVDPARYVQVITE